MEEETLDTGYYCNKCGWYETGALEDEEVIQGVKRCLGCGCSSGEHVPAKVVWMNEAAKAVVADG